MRVLCRLLLLLGSWALLLGGTVAIAQEPPAETTQPPAVEAPAAQEPPPTTTPGQVQIPQVTVRAPQPKRQSRTARRTPAPPTRARVTPWESPTAPPVPVPSPPTASPFNPPYAPLSTDTSIQIQSKPSENFGDLFFTKPGATSAGLAPGAARPILRGLADAHVRIQENGVASGDVSDLGQDHGIPIDPLAVQRTEILRGPAALRFGSQAVGGVVEAINNRIPTAAPPGGVAAELRTGATTVNDGWESGLLLDAGGPNAAIHADVFGRRAKDYRIPSYPYLFPPDPPPVVDGRQPNTSLHTEGAAVGGSWLFDGGYAGAAISRFASDYHIPGIEAAARATHIRLEQTRITSKGEYRAYASAVAAVRYWAGHVDYKHHEIGLNPLGFEQIAATFKNQESEGKVELESMPLFTPAGPLTAIVGSQFRYSALDTAGEALLFPARTRMGAGYFFGETQHFPTLRTQLAARIEQVNITGTAVTFPGDFLPPPDEPAASPADLNFTPKSVSVSLIQDLPYNWLASLNVQRIERAPRAVELFSKGPHDATQTFDIGNANLTIETAKSVEIGLKRPLGFFRFDGKAYYTRYDRFIFQQPTGIFCDEDFASCGTGTELLQTVWSQRDAVFRGAELAWQWDVAPMANGMVGADGQFDTVRATFTDGGNVPRMPPMRVGGGAYWRSDNWFVRMGLLHAFAQTDLAPFETPTAAYDLLRLEIVHRRFWKYSPWGPIEVTTGIVGDNLLNDDVRNSTQFHKDEILLPGRNFKFFLNVKYDAIRPSGPPGTYKTAAKGIGGAPMPYYKAPALPPGWSWAGLYLGGNVGYSWARWRIDSTFTDVTTEEPLFGSSLSSKPDGVILGGQAGYNWKADIWVVGIEGDLQASPRSGSLRLICPTNFCDPTLVGSDGASVAEIEHKMAWLATLRGRFGAAITPQALAYVTAGVAVTDLTFASTVGGFNDISDPVATAFSNHTIRVGWTIGVGLEAHLIGNWTGKLEFLHMDFGSLATHPITPPDATVAAALDTRITDKIVRIGLNHKLER